MQLIIGCRLINGNVSVVHWALWPVSVIKPDNTQRQPYSSPRHHGCRKAEGKGWELSSEAFATHPFQHSCNAGCSTGKLDSHWNRKELSPSRHRHCDWVRRSARHFRKALPELLISRSTRLTEIIMVAHADLISRKCRKLADDRGHTTGLQVPSLRRQSKR